MSQPPKGPGFLEKRFFNLFRDFPRFSRRFQKQLQGDGLLIVGIRGPVNEPQGTAADKLADLVVFKSLTNQFERNKHTILLLDGSGFFKHGDGLGHFQDMGMKRLQKRSGKAHHQVTGVNS